MHVFYNIFLIYQKKKKQNNVVIVTEYTKNHVTYCELPLFISSFVVALNVYYLHIGRFLEMFLTNFTNPFSLF